MLLVAASGLDLVSGQFGQPATLGFVVFTSGLTLASINRSGTAATVPIEWRPSRPIRGRSPVAEAIINARTAIGDKYCNRDEIKIERRDVERTSGQQNQSKPGGV
jgi:hypothetical protein